MCYPFLSWPLKCARSLQVRAVILGGPGTDDDYFSYLENVDKLHVAVKFIEEELRKSKLLISKAMETIKTDFWDILTESR